MSIEKTKYNTFLHYITLFLILFGLLVLTFTYFFTNSKMEDYSHTYSVEPSQINELSDGSKEYIFSLDSFENNTQCIYFYTAHQFVYVYEGDAVLYSYDKDGGFWTSSPGSTYHFVEIDGPAQEIRVVLTPVYRVSYRDITFHAGDTASAVAEIYRGSIAKFVASIIMIIFAIVLMAYYIWMNKKLNLTQDAFYLSIFSGLVGIWALNETDICAIIIRNKIFDSLVPYYTLMLLVPPFIMFLHNYLQLRDKYIYKIILTACDVEFIVLNILHFTKIREFRENLVIMQAMLVIATLYFLVALANRAIHRQVTRRIQVCIIGLGLFGVSMVYDLIQYYRTLGDADAFGRYMFILFVVALAYDLVKSTNEIITKGRHAKELEAFAITDQMTGVYNRNAYETHIAKLKDLNDVLVVICDLNNLKATNDNFGHDMGDEYILESAKIISEVFSKSGNIYRTGGDEFYIIIEGGKNLSMEKAIRSIRTKCMAANVVTSAPYKIEIAIGYARFDKDQDLVFSDIVRRADTLMYENKKELKND